MPAVVYKVKSILLAQIHSDRVFNLPHEELQKQLVTRSLWLMQCFYTHGDNSQKQIRQNCRKKLHESVWALWNRLSCQLLVIRWAALERWHCLEMLNCFNCRCWKQILFIAAVVSNAARAGSQTQSGSHLFSSCFGEVVFFLNNVGFIFIPASFPSFSFIPSRAELRESLMNGPVVSRSPRHISFKSIIWFCAVV